MALFHILDTLTIIGQVWGLAALIAAAIWILAAWSALK
jgi:hypothetical protein